MAADLGGYCVCHNHGCGAQCVLDLVHLTEFFLLVTALLFALPRANLRGPGLSHVTGMA